MDTPDNPPSQDGGKTDARFGDIIQAAARPVVGFGRPPEPGPVHRASLAAAHDQRQALRAEVKAHIATIARLDKLAGGHAEATAAMAAFEAEEAAELRTWASAATDEPPPMPDVERRAELAEALRVAEQRAAAATAARQAAEAEALRLNGSLAPIDAAINAQAAFVIAAEAEPIIARVRASISQLEADLADMNAVAALLLNETERAKAVQSPAAAGISSAAVGFIDRTRFAAELGRMVGVPDAAREKWATTLAELKQENQNDE